MKTDGQYFAARMQQTLEEEGLHPIKAAYVRDRIIETAEAKGWPEVSLNARARISKFSVEMQSVFVDDEGMAVLHTGIGRTHQPLVKIENFGQPRQQRQIVRKVVQRAA
jgi:hypothetical protein